MNTLTETKDEQFITIHVDDRARGMYLRCRITKVAYTVTVSQEPDINIDYDADGNMVGIKFLNVNSILLTPSQPSAPDSESRPES